MNATLSFERPDQPEILLLLVAGEQYAAKLYPAESNHFLSVSALCADNVRFAVGRNEAGVAVATGAISLNGDWAEVKRMWVEPEARGKGLSKAMLAFLESCTREVGTAVLRLETGIHNVEALRLYARSGFTECGPFADYGPDPHSVFMEKRLASG